MKKLITSATICASFFCLNLANAAGDVVIPNGTGTISLKAPAVMKLESFNQKAAYDIVCKVRATNASNSPVIFRIDTYNLNLGMYCGVKFDGNFLTSGQAKIIDDNEHAISINGINTGPANGMINASIVLTKLMGDDANPFYYDCSAYYEVGIR